MTLVHPSPLLRRALWADATVSGAVALLQVAAAAPLAALLQLPQALLFESGLFLVAYTLMLVLIARSPRLPAALVQMVVAGNVGWALAAAAVAVVLEPAALGVGFLLMHAAAVLLFAALERAGLQQSPAASPGAALAR
jgi:hypothetical protein